MTLHVRRATLDLEYAGALLEAELPAPMAGARDGNRHADGDEVGGIAGKFRSAGFVDAPEMRSCSTRIRA